MGKGPYPLKAPIISLPIETEPFKPQMVDIAGPLPICKKSGNRFIFTIMYLATRDPIAVPLQRHAAADIVSVLLEVFCTYGIATKCISDNGSNLTSDLRKEVIRIFNVEHTFSRIVHPQSQGYVEQFHSTLKRGLKAFVDRYPNN